MFRDKYELSVDAFNSYMFRKNSEDMCVDGEEYRNVDFIRLNF